MPHFFCYVLLFFIASTHMANAASKVVPLHIQLVTDFAPQLDDTPQNAATKLMLDIEKALDGQLSLAFVPASRLREWKQLHTSPDVCLYRKVKNAAREENAIFNQYPIMAFPANRLITLNKPHLPKQMSLADAIGKYRLKVGFTSGRSYGEEIDNYLSVNSGSFIALAGTTSAARLSRMLFEKKIDAIIEFTAVFFSRHNKDPRINDAQYIEIKNASNTLFGHIACSKSPQGKQAIKLFDNVLQQENIQQQVISAHINIFDSAEERRLISALKRAYQVPVKE